MALVRSGLAVLAGVALLGHAAPAVAEPPPWLPRYDLEMQVDVDVHQARVLQRVTWTNRHARPAHEIVFNAHSHYFVPAADIGKLAKTLELLRQKPGEGLVLGGPPIEVHQVSVGGKLLPFQYRNDMMTALEVPLPAPVHQGESVTLDFEFTIHLPQKQGRWGQWKGVTFLSNWLPLVAVYDDDGWHPTPFVPWHQPWYNEAGVFTARATLPCDQVIACTAVEQSSTDLGNGLKRVEFAPVVGRDFAFLCSARYREFVSQAGPIRLRCLAFPEHEHYARVMLRIAAEAIPAYSQWIGPYPYPEFTIVESYFGWNGNECSALVMIDERVFGMPHLAESYVDYLVAHEICHQWWYNIIGTNGYCETWMDEAMATYFTHRLLDHRCGKNNRLLKFPKGLGWLPNIERETYRHYGMYGTLGRGENCAVVQEMDKFGHVVNLFSLCYDKGSKIVGLIEERLGSEAFIDFTRLIYAKYQFRILRVTDYQKELEAYTGRSWEEFFRQWLHGPGMSDWAVDKVKVDRHVGQAFSLPGRQDACPTARGQNHTTDCRFFAALKHESARLRQPCKVTVTLEQKGDVCEPTTLGFCFDGGDGYQLRLPIQPTAQIMEFDDPPAKITVLPDKRVQVEILLPEKPTQIAVDPDQLIPDTNPANNFWKPKVRFRFTPLYTLLDDTDLTTAYDSWNVNVGPWVSTPTNIDPWYTRSTMFGLRAGLYRTQHFSGGVYSAYRTDFRDIVAGADGILDHWPWPRTQVGFNFEQRLATAFDADTHPNRAALFGRYVIDYGSSLYLPPFQYVEAFGTFSDNFLPFPRQVVLGSRRYEDLSTGGIHYHINYLTPYWDPDGGYQLDVTYAGGEADFGRSREAVHQGSAQLSFVKGVPDGLGWLSRTRLAFRLYGAAAFPDDGQFFPLGGNMLLRGYDMAQQQGSAVWVSSVEWRVPIIEQVCWDCLDHASGVRNVYAALFYDVGQAYADGRSIGPVAHAVGGGLRLDMVWFSFIERSTLGFDLAKTVNDNTPLQLWLRVGVPF